MDLREWLAGASAEERERVAREANSSVAYLWQLAGGHRRPSLEKSLRIEKATGGDLKVEDLRPDLAELVPNQSRLGTAAESAA